MGAREDPAADLRVHAHRAGRHRVELGGSLLIPELAHVEVALLRVRADGGEPAEHDVAARLGQALPLDHPLSLVRELGRRGVWLEHGRLRLLDLEEERVLLVAADEQGDPGAGADAADTDHLVRRVDEAVLVVEVAVLTVQRLAVLLHHVLQPGLRRLQLLAGEDLVERNQHRRVAGEPQLAVDPGGELRERAQAILTDRLRNVAVEGLALLLADLGPERLADLRHINSQVPDVEVAEPGELAHVLAVLACCRQHQVAPL